MLSEVKPSNHLFIGDVFEIIGTYHPQTLIYGSVKEDRDVDF